MGSRQTFGCDERPLGGGEEGGGRKFVGGDLAGRRRESVGWILSTTYEEVSDWYCGCDGVWRG